MTILLNRFLPNRGSTMNPNDSNEDRDLRERFASLRREDVLLAPDFAVVQRRPSGGQPAWSRWAAAAAAMVMVAAVLLVKFYPRPAAPAQSLTEWKSPTDFLLETPGRGLLQTPSFGPWATEPLPAESPTPAGKKKS
jgi:anti-sigma factor RsiW